MFKRIKLGTAALVLMSLPLTPVQADANPEPHAELSIVPYALNPTQQNFMNLAVDHAINLSDQYGLWTSIMMAQAIIESNWGTSQLGSAPNYNLFGMKANDDWPGRCVIYPTKEWDKNLQQYVTIDAKFRAYDNYGDSFNDNAQKLRFGLSWDRNYYSGTWLENTSTYQDSANWLQGRYATSPTYASTLIKTIKTYNLAQYDPQVENLNETATITYVPGYSIKVYTSFASRLKNETGTMLKHGSEVNISKKITLHDGSSYYKIGDQQWIPTQYASVNSTKGEVSENGVVRVKYVPGYSIAVWDRATDDRVFTGQKLLHGTDWKYFSKYCVNGKVWYNVGRNQWIDGTYITKMW